MGRRVAGGMGRLLGTLQHWSTPILRVLLWAVALAYLLLEAREVAMQRQLTQITVFAVLFLVANFQINLARYLGPQQQETRAIVQASLAMFSASLFSILDGALDYLLGSLQGEQAIGVVSTVYGLGWGLNVLCVLLAIGSMELFLSSVQRLIAES